MNFLGRLLAMMSSKAAAAESRDQGRRSADIEDIVIGVPAHLHPDGPGRQVMVGDVVWYGVETKMGRGAVPSPYGRVTVRAALVVQVGDNNPRHPQGLTLAVFLQDRVVYAGPVDYSDKPAVGYWTWPAKS